MDFSELYKCTKGVASFSPCGKYVANASGYRLVIKEVESLQLIQLYTCDDQISKVEWSKDSQYILAVLSKRGQVDVRSIEDESWQCKIAQKGVGVVNAHFGPDSRHVIVASNFQLRLSIYSLCDESIHHIQSPKFTSSTRGLDFSKDGKYMIVAERHKSKDYINVIVTETWELVKQFACNTKNLVDCKFTPNDQYILVWDTLTTYQFSLYALDGQLITTYSAYDDALGLKSVSSESNARLIALGSYDEKVRVLNSLNWNVSAVFEHRLNRQSETGIQPVVFKEVEYNDNVYMMDDEDETPQRTRYIIQELPYSIKPQKVNFNKPKPKKGVGNVAFSSCGRYLCSINDNMPTALWIWDIPRMSLKAVIEQLEPIRGFEWDPIHTRLALCSGNGRIYLWSVDGCSCVDVPALNFKVTKVKWSSTGESLLLNDSHNYCLCYPMWNQE